MTLAPRLLALLPNPLLHARLHRALIGNARRPPLHWALHPVHDWEELLKLLPIDNVETVLADPYAGALDGDGMDDLRWTELARRAPNVLMIAYGDFPRHPARDVLRLAAAGIAIALQYSDLSTGVLQARADGNLRIICGVELCVLK